MRNRPFIFEAAGVKVKLENILGRKIEPLGSWAD